eukprot:3853906-Prymnesium_polylepis.1
MLSDAKAHVDRLKGAARKRKTDARKKQLTAEELANKLKAIDEKLAWDLLAYACTAVELELPEGVVQVKRERPPPAPPTPVETESQLRDAVQAAEDAAAIAECDLVAARRCMERADSVRKELHNARMESAFGGWKLDDEAYEALKVQRAELDAAWDRHLATASELRQYYKDAQLHEHDAKFAAEEARANLAAHRTAVKHKAEVQAADEERHRLAKHRALMDLYDTMTEEEISAYVRRRRFDDPFKDSPLRQPLAPGPPRVYNLRGDPATWQLP